MKNLCRPILGLAVLFLIAGVAPPPAHSQDEVEDPDAIVYVDGLACPFCAYGLEKKLKDLEAVQKIEVQMDEERVLLAFKDGRTLTKEAIQEAVKKAGFTARKIEFPEETPSPSASS